jgi:O-methyltransferase
MNVLKAAVQGSLGLVGLRLQRRAGQPDPILLWDEDPRFARLYETIRPRTLVDTARCFILYQHLQQSGPLEGDLAEVGVYRGGTARLLAEMAPARVVHLFDTFEGMPETDGRRDLHRQGDFADTSLDAVKAFLAPVSNVRFHPGFFPETAAPVRDARFRFVHCDADIHRSVTDCCEFFHPRLVPGGVMVFDDYGFRSCPGARTAVDEFFRDRPESPVYLPTGQCVVTRHPQ